MRQFLVSMEKRSTTLKFSSRWIILMEFLFVFISLGFVFKVKDKSVELFIGNEICFQENFTSQCEFAVWANRCFFLTVRKTKVCFLWVSSGFFWPDWVWFELRNRWQVHLGIENNFPKSLIFRPITIREKMKFNYSTISAFESTDEWTFTPMIWFSYETVRRFDGETIDNILLFISIDVIFIVCDSIFQDRLKRKRCPKNNKSSLSLTYFFLKTIYENTTQSQLFQKFLLK